MRTDFQVDQAHPAARVPAGFLARGQTRIWTERRRLSSLVVLAVLVPLSWFPWRWPVLTLLALPLLPLWWYAGWRTGERLVTPGVPARPLLALLLATSLATLPIVDWRAGMAKVLGMAVGVFVVLLALRWVRSRDALWAAVFPLCGAVLALVVVRVVGVLPAGGKFPLLDLVVGRVTGLVGSGALPRLSGAVNPNELAGVLVLLLPVVWGYFLGALWVAPGGAGPRLRYRGLGVAAALIAGTLGLGVLLSTQSRSGLAGAGAAVIVVGAGVALRIGVSPRFPRPVRLLVPLGYLGAVGAGAWLAMRALATWIVRSGSGFATEGAFLESRVELWSRSLYLLQDFPLTGIGLGQFDVVVRRLYPPFLIPPADVVPHPHNVYLAYAVELGLPGAVAMGALLWAFFRHCVRAIRYDDPLLRCTGAGLAAGVFAFLVYGLTDAINPGARAAVFLWALLGLGLATGGLVTRAGAAAGAAKLDGADQTAPAGPCAAGVSASTSRGAGRPFTPPASGASPAAAAAAALAER